MLFIFAGAAAEFALNKAVDWLYFTGKLPADPIGRLFSTVSYARLIVFADMDTALKSIDRISAIHAGVESMRGQEIPQEAYRDVLFMLIHYSITAYELLGKKTYRRRKRRSGECFYKSGKEDGYKVASVGISCLETNAHRAVRRQSGSK